MTGPAYASSSGSWWLNITRSTPPSTGPTADELFAVNSYDLVVLDWTIPAPNGHELLRRWRAGGSETPVLLLTGHQTVADRVNGLDSGADDYLTKPFAIDELLARVRSLLRRVPRPLVAQTVGDLTLDPARKAVEVGGEPVAVSAKEYAILEYLMAHRDAVVSRTDLTEHVWDNSFDAMSNVVDAAIYRLRRKIDGDRRARLLHTVRGLGYRLSSRREE